MALGLAAISWAWLAVVPYYGLYCHVLLLTFSLLLAFPAVVKFICYPRVLINELNDPVVISILPTFAMLGFLCSDLFARFNMETAGSLWGAMIVLHCFLLLVFFHHHVLKGKLSGYLHSWFIPPVGIGLAATAMPAVHYPLISSVVLGFASIICVLILTMFFLRLVIYKHLPKSESPTVVIYAAPASICLSGYLTIAHEPISAVVLSFAVFSIAFVLLGYYFIVNIVRTEDYSPLFSCFVFPLAISTIAVFKFSHWLGKEFSPELGYYFKWVANVELAIATLVTVYVFVNYLRFYARNTAQGS